MRSLKEALVHKHQDHNPFCLTKKDLIGELKYFPIGVVVRMMEEQSLQGNKSNVKVFQEDRRNRKIVNGFDWADSETGFDFWYNVISRNNFDLFFEKYPEYKKYNI